MGSFFASPELAFSGLPAAENPAKFEQEQADKQAAMSALQQNQPAPQQQFEIPGAAMPASSAALNKFDRANRKMTEAQVGLADEYTAQLQAADAAAQKQEAVIAEREQQKQQAMQAAQASVEKQKNYARFSLPDTEVDRLNSVADDPNASQSQKTIAAARLHRAQSLDPDRLFQSQGQKIAAALFAGLGQIGAGLAGGPNVALQVIQKRIDQDLMAQKDSFDRNQGRVGEAQTAYDRISREFSDDISRLHGAKALMYDAVQRKLSILSSQSKSLEVQENSARLNAELQMHKEQAEQQLALERYRLGLAANAPGKLAPQQKENLGFYQRSASTVKNLKDSFKKNTGVFSVGAHLAPQSDAAAYNAQRQAAAIFMARGRGGNTSKESINAYLDLIPSASTSDTKAKAMFDELEKQLQLGQKSIVAGEEDLTTPYDNGD